MKPRIRRWQPQDFHESNHDPADNFDRRLPLGDIPPVRIVQPETTYRPAARPYACQDCGGSDFYQVIEGGRWLCSSCRPQKAPRTVQDVKPAAIRPKISITFYPMLLLAARRVHYGGAVRLFILAKNYDAGGRGVIDKKPFRQYVEALGVSDRCFRNWLRDAVSLGIFEPWRDDKKKFNLVSLQRAAAILGCYHLDKSPASMPAKYLLQKGWRVRVWKAYNKVNHNGQNISRIKKFSLTAVPPGTQGRYNRLGKIRGRRNIAISNISADNLDGMREYGNRPGLHAFNDPAQAAKGEKFKRVLAWHIPSKVKINTRNIQAANHGRGRSVKHALRNNQSKRLSKFAIIPSDLQDPGRAQTVRRIFCNNDADYQAAIKQRKKCDYLERDDIYTIRSYKRTNKTVGVYSLAS